MAFKGKNFAIAVTLTVLDMAVACRYGSVTWLVCSKIIWCRLLLVLFAAAWVTGLADLWSRVGRAPQGKLRLRRVRLSKIAPALDMGGV